MNSNIIKWQQPMMKVLIALTPIALFSIYLFGWRVLALLMVCNATAFAIEFLFVKKWNEPVSSAIFVTGSLFVFSLPPTIPFWMAVAGVIFGVLFGKMLFGGFGRNVFNPALTGRAFLYISFGAHMTSNWLMPFTGFPGGFTRWFNSTPEAITQATPGMLIKDGNSFHSGWLSMLSGIEPGVIGGTGTLLTLACGVYIVLKKAANYRIVTSGLLAFLVFQTFFWLAGAPKAADPINAITSSSFIFGIFFYATDPVSACQTDIGRWIYGALVGGLSSIISVFSIWPAGTMFAILLGNMFAPLIDIIVRKIEEKQNALAE